jgi:hypothetical protein
MAKNKQKSIERRRKKKKKREQRHRNHLDKPVRWAIQEKRMERGYGGLMSNNRGKTMMYENKQLAKDVLADLENIRDEDAKFQRMSAFSADSVFSLVPFSLEQIRKIPPNKVTLVRCWDDYIKVHNELMSGQAPHQVAILADLKQKLKQSVMAPKAREEIEGRIAVIEAYIAEYNDGYIIGEDNNDNE